MKKIHELFEKKTYASGLVRPKTTSLFFDKIWVPSHRKLLIDFYGDSYIDIPDEVCFCEGDLIRAARYDRTHRSSVRISKALYTDFVIAKNTQQNSPYVVNKKMQQNYSRAVDFVTSNNRNEGIDEAVIYFRNNYGIEMVPIYVDKTEFEKSMMIIKGDNNETNYCDSVIEASIKGIPTIIEEKLSWEQVLEIRKDKKSIEKIRKFRSWASMNFEGKSSAQITEILGMKLDDYESALRKHGIVTAIGGFTTILTSSATVFSAIGNNKPELVAAGIMATASLLKFSSQKLTEYLETKHSPIAFIYDLGNKLKN